MILSEQSIQKLETILDKIQSYINSKLSTISSEESAKEAANKMLEDLVHSLIVMEGDNHIRHIVATVDNQVTGVLSIQDFAHYHSRNISDPVSEFWSNSEVLLDEQKFRNALDKLLSTIADKLGDASKTGKAIKAKEPLPTIAQFATEEGLNDLSCILRLATEA